MDTTERDKRVADLVAHKTPEEMARQLVELQAAQPDLHDSTQPQDLPQPSPPPEGQNTLRGLGGEVQPADDQEPEADGPADTRDKRRGKKH